MHAGVGVRVCVGLRVWEYIFVCKKNVAYPKKWMEYTLKTYTLIYKK